MTKNYYAEHGIWYFCGYGHSVDNFSFSPIDKVENEWPRLLKETYWVHRLKTLSPNGMNTKVPDS